MKEGRLTLIVIIVTAMLAASCKPAGGRAGREPGPSKTKQASAKETEKKPEPAGPTVNPEQKCGGYQEKIEAERRAVIEALGDPYRSAERIAVFMDFIDEVGRLGAERRTGELGALVQAAGKDAPALIPSWNESYEKYMLAVARTALGGYASCRALSDDDPTWCESIDKAWEEERAECRDTHFYFRILAKKVIADGTACEKALENLPTPGNIDPADAVAGCKAVVNRNPDGCPFDKATKPMALCRALALRDGRGPCEELASEHADRWVPCCQNFTWRFANVAARQGDSRLIPEMGALSGDAAGCDNGLAWEVFGPLAPLFGVQGIEGDSLPPLEGKAPDGPCPFQIRWSSAKVPGR